MPSSGAEVDRQLPGGLARLGEVLDGDDPADAHVDGEELVVVDHARTHAPASASPSGEHSTASRADGERRRSRALRPEAEAAIGGLDWPRVPTSLALPAPPLGVASSSSFTPSGARDRLRQQHEPPVLRGERLTRNTSE